MQMPRLVIAGTHSGCGKSSVAMGLMRALTRRGLRVAPFKVGPDFIDPSLLAQAAGRPTRNLDSWMLPHPTVLELFARGCSGADVAVIEGMMGLYDGHGGSGDEGSTAEVARLLGAPVLLVVDVGGSVRSAAAMALGFAAFDPQVRIVGVIANRAGGARHVDMLRDALQSSGLPLLGGIPSDDRLQIPERHLGLVPALEAPPDAVIEALSDAVSSHVDLDALLRTARPSVPIVVPGPLAFPPIPSPETARIGIARDEAFTFYYQDGLELLESFGADLVPFSPIHDRALPGVDGLYLGGGFPEVYARELSENAAMRQAIAAAVRGAMPVYAECGGLLYLSRRLVGSPVAGAGEESHEMAGVIAATARVHGRLVALNYVSLEATSDTLLLRRGESVRGHEFHWSTVEPERPLDFAYRSSGGRGIQDGRDGIATSSLLATYTHVHFAARPEMAQRFVDACRRFREAYKE